ncbi:gluconeogenesis factor YvcK family protein [Terracidiphilus gabretensis]|uniref:gluconeogenesis factor YvcK family protein n=1 Tax=Terracidiphilus gabretensis TaxID=1577687 RepID=UPI00071B9507|nr:gluconeogenesis factor YvcK family protein [Terracidiphilus gabretensis]
MPVVSSVEEIPSATRPLRVVAIGGGTGLSTLLRGLCSHVTSPGTSEPGQISDLAAVVTVTDDGGSSGRLRKDFNMLPPGDLRNCMVALSEEHDLLAKLFDYRFRSGTSLEGHSFGNLFVAALTDITGDFGQAIQLASKILATRGKIYPVTTANATLIARMDDGSLVRGETNITASKRRIEELMLEPPDAAALPETLEAIAHADLITVGPGSLYTSLITNLLVQGIPTALASARGLRVFVCNLMTQANESLGLTASQHIERIYEHTRASIFDYALVNVRPFTPETLARYAAEGASPIEADIERVEALGVKCIAGDFATEETFVRHSASRVTGALLALGRTALVRQS